MGPLNFLDIGPRSLVLVDVQLRKTRKRVPSVFVEFRWVNLVLLCASASTSGQTT